MGFRSERGAVLAAIMAATALVALDATVLATAVPTIVKELGGFSQFPWLFSIYLLTSAVATPLFGRLADTRGRRPVLLSGIGVFLAGLELMITATALPSILLDLATTDELGKPAFSELRHASWIVNGYLLAYVIAMPLAGRIADVWGARRLFLGALGLFVVWNLAVVAGAAAGRLLSDTDALGQRVVRDARVRHEDLDDAPVDGVAERLNIVRAGPPRSVVS